MIERIRSYFKSIEDLDNENLKIKRNKKKVDKKVESLIVENNELQKELLEIYREREKTLNVIEYHFNECKKQTEIAKKYKLQVAKLYEKSRLQEETIDKLTIKVEKLEKKNKKMKAEKENEQPK